MKILETKKYDKLFMTDAELVKDSINDFTLDLIEEIQKIVREQGKQKVMEMLS